MTTRGQILKDAAELTEGDRNKAYGPPYENLDNCAVLFSAYLYAKYGGEIIDPNQFSLIAEDVAWFNVMQKIERTFTGAPREDTYIDAAAYAAIAFECRMEEQS